MAGRETERQGVLSVHPRGFGFVASVGFEDDLYIPEERMAGAMHGSVGNVILIESGDILEFDELGARKAGRVNVGRVCIDSGSIDDVVQEVVIRDRRHLSEDGIVLPIIAINRHTGRMENPGWPPVVRHAGWCTHP